MPPAMTLYDATVEPAPQAATAGVSMVIHNTANTSVTITGASSPLAQKVVMQHYVQREGVTQMYPMEQIDIPAQADLTIVPFGLEFRLMNVSRDITYGMDVPLTLTFANGSQRTVRLTVQTNINDEDAHDD